MYDSSACRVVRHIQPCQRMGQPELIVCNLCLLHLACCPIIMCVSQCACSHLDLLPPPPLKPPPPPSSCAILPGALQVIDRQTLTRCLQEAATAARAQGYPVQAPPSIQVNPHCKTSTTVDRCVFQSEVLARYAQPQSAAAIAAAVVSRLVISALNKSLSSKHECCM